MTMLRDKSSWMKNYMKIIIQPVKGLMLGLLIFVANPAQADFINGDQLRLYCASKNPNDEAICMFKLLARLMRLPRSILWARKPMG